MLKGFRVSPSETLRDAIRAKVHLMSPHPLRVHGRNYHWAAVSVSDSEPKYLRINPVTNELETTSLLDSTARLLVRVHDTGLGTKGLEITDSAYGMH